MTIGLAITNFYMKRVDLLKTLEQLESALKQLDLVSVTSDEAQSLNLNMGTPTADQLAKINTLTGKDCKASEWYVVPFRASDNLVSRSIRKWHNNVLSQMQSQLVGRPLLVDHNWDEVEDSVGLIFDCKMSTSTNCPENIWNQPGKADLNRSIIAKEGYKCLYALACISSEMTAVIQGIESRRLNDCSTGGFLSGMRLICPNCTHEKGREISFTEQDKNGEYTCPHLIPDQYTSMYDDGSHLELPYADYLELDGTFDGIELSLCNAGNLPAASVCR